MKLNNVFNHLKLVGSPIPHLWAATHSQSWNTHNTDISYHEFILLHNGHHSNLFGNMLEMLLRLIVCEFFHSLKQLTFGLNTLDMAVSILELPKNC